MPGRRARVGAALLLVVGAVVAALSATTVAASWVDRAIGSSRFTTSPFGLESSVNNGGTWAAHPANAPAVMTLSAASLLPGQSTYGAVSLRAVTASPQIRVTVDATSTTAGLGSVLRYSVIRSATCVAANFTAPGASYVIGSAAADVPVTTDSAANAVILPAGTSSATGSPVPLCFRLSLPDTLAVWTNSTLQTSFPATWTFVGTT
ncbi:MULTISPECIES: hypothetical protein [unclassified Rhodococcus (in: high G+C Gram-positive bacteria)]|uniref:hypothetical protein n=1 Tax=unclassified Rhodococcus (in: high G+C Gram-positive bacteria) TaxID=192944 RepID=UPI0012DEF3A4|nr:MULTISPECIES: hypothetical protein [unclassified Rhodococcus (in: high G+C Gram-positive bacteria)]MDQ1203617.1 hypothetical protein [Rhodococcus sp. SORGH_AS_0303]